MWNYKQTDELCHYGILGMKWGIRRYQNADGSLTPAGKKRYSNDYNEVRNLKRKGVKGMSNEELRKVNNRDSLERNYRSNNSKILRGMAIVGATAGTIGAVSGIMKNSPQIINTGKKALRNVNINLPYYKISDLKIKRIYR